MQDVVVEGDLVALSAAPIVQLPVRLSRFDLRGTGHLQPVELQAAGEPVGGEDWGAHPVLVWQHVFTATPDATVHVRAGDTPVVVSRRYGRGAGMVVGAAPLGEVPEGATPCWKWPGWSALMTRLIRGLLPRQNAAAAGAGGTMTTGK